MDEHDDDLESAVHEEATEETDTYPDTGDELDEPDVPIKGEADEDDPSLHKDDAEL